MGINLLYDIYQKDPDYVESILRGHIKIEKLYNASKFCIEKLLDGNFKYYKNKEVELSLIDRTFSSYYDDPINHFEQLSENKKRLIPIFWKFDMDFLFKNDSIFNNLILTCIKIKNENGKIIDIIYNKEILDKWADILEVSSPQIFFDGCLSKNQYDKIVSYLNTPIDDISSLYNGDSFSKYLLNLLSDSNTNNINDEEIDGLIITFDNGEKYKIESSKININDIKSKYNKSTYYDTFYIVLSMIDEFYSVINYKNIKLTETGFNNRYLEFIENTFLLFIKSSYYKKIKNENISLYFPEYLTNRKYGFNIDLIKNEYLKSFLTESFDNIVLYKTFLNYMRTRKKKEVGIYDRYSINIHNSNVNKIIDFISNKEMITNEFQTFNEFKTFILLNDEDYNMQQENIYEIDDIHINDMDDDKDKSGIIVDTETNNDSKEKKENKKSNTSIDKNELSNKNKIDNVNNKANNETEKNNNVEHPLINIAKKIIENSKNKNNKEDLESEVSNILTKRRNIIVLNGLFFPILNDTISVINEVYKKYKIPIYLIIKKESLDLYHIDENFLNEILSITVENENNIKGYKIYNGYTLNDIYKQFTPSINILYYIGDENDCNDILLFKNKKLNIIKSSSIIDQKYIIEKLTNDDYKWFISNTPKYLHNYYLKIKNYFIDTANVKQNEKK